MKKSLGIYIHVPFCTERCDYCSFCSMATGTKNEDLIRNYISCLCAELTSYTTKNEYCVDTIYLGGGTPSVLPVSEIERIFQCLYSAYNIDDTAEITIETNPGQINTTYFYDLFSLGINRVSMGIQTLDRETYKIIGRKGGFATEKVLDVFFNFNCRKSIDFIAGTSISRNTADEIAKTLHYDPEHMSVYLLSIDTYTPLSKRLSMNDELEENQVLEYEEIVQLLKSKGYTHYEVSNWCLENKISRHNSRYWQFLPYIGAGAGAHSFFRNERYANTSDINAYCRGKRGVIKDVRSVHDSIVEFFLVTLRTSRGAYETEFKEFFGMGFPESVIEKVFQQNEYFDIEGSEGCFHISLKEKRMLFADEDAYNLVNEFLGLI